MEPVSFGRIWPETIAALRRHYDLLLPVAAAFLFLPQLLFAWHLGDTPPKELFGEGRLLADVVAISLLMLVSLIGQLAIAFVIVNDGTADRTLGNVLKGAALLLFPALAASLIQGMAVGFGILLLIIPGLWLIARLAPVIPLVATEHHDPIAAISGSWNLTKGRSLAILGMISILFLGFAMLTLGISGLGAALGVVTTLAAGKPVEGWGIGRWAVEVLGAGASALFGATYIAFLSVLTRALKANPQEAG